MRKYVGNLGVSWSNEEDDLLIKYYYEFGVKRIAEVLNRTEGACRNRVYYLNKKGNVCFEKTDKRPRNWTKEEMAFLKENYPDKGAEWVADKLKRSREACVAQARSLNVRRSYRWNEEEEEILRNYYPIYGTIVSSELLDRDRKVCEAKAKSLGIKYINVSLWTDEEVNFLKKYYAGRGSKYVAKSLGRSEKACLSKAVSLGLKSERFWSERDIAFLKKNYPNKGAKWVAEHLGKSSRCCRSYAYKNGIKYIDKRKWTNEQVEVLKKYYPVLGKYVAELIPGKSMKACISEAIKLKITYKKRDSSSVEKIKEILNTKRVYYKQEVGFRECIDKNVLLFDFALYKDCNYKEVVGLIEYDGMQHFGEVIMYRRGDLLIKGMLEVNQRHDKIKNEFCWKKNIPMLRIRYDQDNIEELIESFLSNMSNFKEWFNSRLSYEEYYNDIRKGESKVYYVNKYSKDKIVDLGDIYVKEWTLEEDTILKKYYPSYGSVYVAKYLDRTAQACISRASRLGVVRSNKWTRKEDAFLLKNYLSKGSKWCSLKLNRTVSAVNHRVRRIGVDKKTKKWNETEDEILLKYYRIKSKKEIAEMLSRSIGSVDNRLRILKRDQNKDF